MSEQEFFTYKGYPLVRNEKTMYYGNMSDKYVAMITILETRMIKDLEVAKKTRVQIMATDPTTPINEMVVKSGERGDLYDALDVAEIWLTKFN